MSADKQIVTLADLLDYLAACDCDRTKTPVYLYDGVYETRVSVTMLSHSSKPKDFTIRFEKVLDRELVVAGMARRQRDAEEEISRLVAKLDRLRADLTLHIQIRDQSVEMLKMFKKAEERRQS